MGHLCSAKGGDCFVDDFPNNADCILFSHFLSIWNEEQNRFLIRKSFETLPKNGQVIILEVLVWENEKGSHAAISASAYFLALASGHGITYKATDYENWLKEAGFTKVRRQRLPQEHVVITGTK